MITAENIVLFKNPANNMFYYSGPIGEVPRFGTPVKDKNGADVYTMPEGVQVWSYDVKTNKFDWFDVTKLTVEQDCEVCDVKIGPNHVIVSTNESLSVFNESTGELEKIAPKGAEGLLVPVCRKLPGIKNAEPFDNLTSFEDGWLHGMMLGDGWLSGNYVGFTKLEETKMNVFVERLQKRVGKKLEPRFYRGSAATEKKYGDSMKVHFSDKAVVAWASELRMYDGKPNIRKGKEDRAALHKWIDPMILYVASEGYLWGLLSGLTDSDGCLAKSVKKGSGKVVYYITYSTCSPSMKDSFITLAHRLGMKASLTETVHKIGKGRNVESHEYLLYLSSPDVQKNLDKIRCVGKAESERLADWKTQELYKDDHDIIPISKEEIQLLRKVWPNRVDSSFYASYSKGRVTRANLLSHMEPIRQEKGLERLVSRIENADVVWIPVERVTALDKREVFDLCVPDTKVFVVNNGPVVWDTMTYYVPVSQKAVEEANRLMLPSQNQLAARDFNALPEIQEELVSGAFLASRKKNTPPKAVFNTKAEARDAYRKGLIKIDDNIVIKELNQ